MMSKRSHAELAFIQSKGFGAGSITINAIPPDGAKLLLLRVKFVEFRYLVKSIFQSF